MARKQQLGPTLEAVLTANITKFEKSMARAGRVLDDTAKKFGRVGKRMSLAITVPLAAIGVTSAKAFSNFDDAMTQSTAIMEGMTAKMRESMERTALVMAQEGVTSATDLAKSYFYLASAGMDARKSMELLATVEQFAVAGAFDMATATDLLTDAQTALGMSSKNGYVNLKNLARIGDTLVAANTMANASVQQFSESLTNDAAVAMGQFGMELEEGVAILGAYADQGIKGNVAGSLLGRGIRLLSGAARENTKAFKDMRIEVVSKTTGQYNKLTDIIADMEKAFKGLTRPQRDARLEMLGFAARVQKAITPILGMSDKIAVNTQRLKEMTGFMRRVAERQMKSFANQFKVLRNNIVVASIGIGRILAPALLKLNKAIKGTVQWFDALNDVQKKIVIGFAAIAGGIGPVLLGIAAIARLGAIMSSAAGIIATKFLVAVVWLKGALIALGGILATVAVTLATYPALLLAVVVGVVTLIKTVSGMGFSWEEATNAMLKFAHRTIGFLANISHNFKAFFSWLGQNWFNVIKDMIMLNVTFVTNMASNFMVGIHTVMRLFQAFLGWLNKTALKFFRYIFSDAFIESVKEGLIGAWDAFVIWIGDMANAFVKFADNAWEYFKGKFTGGEMTLADIIKDIGVTKLVTGLGEDFNAGQAEDSTLNGEMSRILGEQGDKIKTPFEGFVSSIEGPPAFKFASDLADKLIPSQRNPFKKGLDALGKMIEKGKESMPGLMDAWEAAGDKLRGEEKDPTAKGGLGGTLTASSTFSGRLAGQQFGANSASERTAKNTEDMVAEQEKTNKKLDETGALTVGGG